MPHFLFNSISSRKDEESIKAFRAKMEDLTKELISLGDRVFQRRLLGSILDCISYQNKTSYFYARILLDFFKPKKGDQI